MAARAEDLQHFSVDEYLRLYEAEPDLLEDTELMNGVIVAVSPESRLHAKAVRHVDELLNAIYDGRSESHGSIRLSNFSLWSPDVYVLRAGIDESLQYPLASDVELVVEISLTTVAKDLGDKFTVYAQEGIPQYWVILPSSPGWARLHSRPTAGVYAATKFVELPDGYRSLGDIPWNTDPAEP